MNLHFLVSISSQSENFFGIRFLCSFMEKGDKNCDITLFHINSSVNDSPSSLLGMWENPDTADQADELDVSAKTSLRKSKSMLESANIPIEKLKTKIIKEEYGKVKDILNEGANGLYDAMILGKRESYALQWIFDRPADEILNALVRDASLSTPMWICSEPEEGRNNVLLCLDGSNSALRMTDHVGYILSFAPRHDVTLYHVCSPLSDDSSDIFEDAEKILKEHNISPTRIQKKKAWGISVTNTILSEKKGGRYAAVAVGLNGLTGKTVHDTRNIVGKTTANLLARISKAALWCCP